MLVIADVAVVVRDARAAAAWWQEKLGFRVHTVGGEGGHAVLVAPVGERFLLHLCEGFEPVDPGNTGIAFVTDEIEGWVERMRASGVRFPVPYAKEAWGGSAKFADPDGNVFWLLGAPTAFIERETARRAGPAATDAVVPRRRRAGAPRGRKVGRRTRSEGSSRSGRERRRGRGSPTST